LGACPTRSFPGSTCAGSTLSLRELKAALPRAEFDVEAALDAVRPIVADVAERGAAALYDAAERFDGIRPARLRVPAEVIADALTTLDPAVRAALEESIRRARVVHADQRRSDTTTQVADGGTVTERWVPVDRVGLYVPGGLAVYPSSVVMNVVPAQLAQVRARSPSPAHRSARTTVARGLPHPTILAACAFLEVDEVYAMGGAQAVAAFAYGFEDDRPEGITETLCEPVSLVTGPGNIYVAAAKRLLKGIIGIDAEAGPTEIAVLADDSADPEHVASDLVSQAEHDPLAASVLVTDSEALADAVDAALARRVPEAKHGERVHERSPADSRDRPRRRRRRWGGSSQRLRGRAPGDPDPRRGVAARVRNAGAIFVGPWSPVSLGDYAAGSNHVLPTGGCAVPQQRAVGAVVPARHPRRHVLDEAALREVGHHVVTLAQAEDLPGPRPGRDARTSELRPHDADRAASPLGRRAESCHRAQRPRLCAMDSRTTVARLLREDLRGRTAYGAPQLDVPVRLNTNENSYPVPPVVVEAITKAVGGCAIGLNRYPDREFTGLREACWPAT
jgi:histidinol dehydrogenase